jgi:hypothetical protein
MTGRDLNNELNKHWQTYCDDDVYISIGDELVSLADIDYDEENSRFVMIPEAICVS